MNDPDITIEFEHEDCTKQTLPVPYPYVKTESDVDDSNMDTDIDDHKSSTNPTNTSENNLSVSNADSSHQGKPDVRMNYSTVEDSTALHKNGPDMTTNDTPAVNCTSLEIGESISTLDKSATHCNTSLEITTYEVRYFKNIGETNVIENDGTVQNGSSVEKSSVLVPINTEVFESNSCGSILNSESSDKKNILNKPPTYTDFRYGKVEMYAPDTGPRIYTVKGNIITPPIITKNLPEAFRALPVHGKAEDKEDLMRLNQQKMRDYVGYGISDDEYRKLEAYCSPDFLKTGKELAMTHSFPSQRSADLKSVPEASGDGQNLCIVKKLKLRMKKDQRNHYPRKLKYRGVRLLPLSRSIEESERCRGDAGDADELLEPGHDLVFRLRVYRPYHYGAKGISKPNRHSVFNNDIVMLGRQRLSVLRDRIACPNDIGMRVDVSDHPDAFQVQAAKQLFPSGFLFINNVFYVDRRAGCADHSAGIREWARKRGFGDFPVRDMGAVRLEQILVRLGHPEVYMHQGSCEHLFTFSEVRLLSPTDPPRLSHYPCHTAISQNQSVYCTTCAEFGAKWIVVGCARVPFDPAFFCDTCFKLYLYDSEGKKIGDFKAYAYKGNTVNFLKRVTGLTGLCQDEESGEEDCI